MVPFPNSKHPDCAWQNTLENLIQKITMGTSFVCKLVPSKFLASKWRLPSSFLLKANKQTNQTSVLQIMGAHCRGRSKGGCREKPTRDDHQGSDTRKQYCQDRLLISLPPRVLILPTSGMVSAENCLWA